MPPVLLPFDVPCGFPNLEILSEDQEILSEDQEILSEDHVCKRIEATVEGEEGAFYGIVCQSTGLPDGYGVFKAG